MRSRDTEKTIRELQQFLREHEDEITDEDSMHRLAMAFMSQHNSRLQPKQTEPEDASDYLELAEARVLASYRNQTVHAGLLYLFSNIDRVRHDALRNQRGRTPAEAVRG